MVQFNAPLHSTFDAECVRRKIMKPSFGFILNKANLAKITMKGQHALTYCCTSISILELNVLASQDTTQFNVPLCA